MKNQDPITIYLKIVWAVFSVSFQTLLLLTTAVMNHRFCFFYFFFNLIGAEWTHLGNSDRTESRRFYFTDEWKLFSKLFPRSGKTHHVGARVRYLQIRKIKIHLCFV